MNSMTNCLAKSLLPTLILFFVFELNAQKTLPMSETVSKREVSMADATGKSSNGVYRYYAKGDDKPFTGILFAKYPNGNYQSWQQFEDGIGQGKWINYYENGNFKEVGNYNKNRVEGPIKKYYESGTLKAEGTYKDWRIKIDEWKYYAEDGKLKMIVDYGQKGSIEEVQEYYDRGDVSYSWYSDILSSNGFKKN